MSKSTIRGVLTALFVVPLLGFLVLGHGTPTVRVAASQASDNQSADDHNGDNCDKDSRNDSEESHESDDEENAENDGDMADDDCNVATTAPPTTAPPTTAPPTTAPPTTNGGGEDVCEVDGLLGPETIADQLVDAGIPLNEPEADGPISSAIVSSLGALSPISSEAACVVSLLTL